MPGTGERARPSRQGSHTCTSPAPPRRTGGAPAVSQDTVLLLHCEEFPSQHSYMFCSSDPPRLSDSSLLMIANPFHGLPMLGYN